MLKLKDSIIVDIDGTLANGEHRQHWLKNKPKNWNAYQAAIHLDTPINPVIDLVNILYSTGLAILLCSGRQEKERKATEEWMKRHEVKYTELYMRPTEDYVDDTVIKERMFHRLKEEYNIKFVIDDRKKVKRKWVELGVFVMDVNQHDIEF